MSEGEVILDGKCPRCAVSPQYPLGGNVGALSRAARDEGAEVIICPECAQREAILRYVGQDPPNLTEWPLSIDQLLAEDRVRYTLSQHASMSTMRIGPDEARGLLEADGEGGRKGGEGR
jgi:hypothetical protein